MQLIADAEKHALQKEGVQIILCTCTTAGGLRIATWCDNIIQCIVDESGMCMEPETLIPIASSKASQVVLIGDHKQLQPVVMNGDAGFLGLSTSLFERYSNHAFMLLKQYRMVSWFKTVNTSTAKPSADIVAWFNLLNLHLLFLEDQKKCRLHYISCYTEHMDFQSFPWLLRDNLLCGSIHAKRFSYCSSCCS